MKLRRQHCRPSIHSSPLNGPCSVQGLAHAVWALCDHLGLETLNLVGFSLGGAVGLEMTLQRPGSVRRLGLINSLATYRLDHWSKWVEAGLALLLIPLLGMRHAARLAARRLFPRAWQSELRERAAEVVSFVPACNYLLTARALLAWTALDRLHLCRTKVLMIAAEKHALAKSPRCAARRRPRLAAWHSLRCGQCDQCGVDRVRQRPPVAAVRGLGVRRDCPDASICRQPRG